MEPVSADRQPRKRRFTQRQLYFFLLWLPLPGHALYLVTGIFHISFAIVHCWNARRTPTQKLLRDSWQVPFNVAAVSFFEALLLDCSRETPWDWPFELHLSGGFALLSFAGALPFLALGWLLLLTVARRWPLDASSKLVLSPRPAQSA